MSEQTRLIAIVGVDQDAKVQCQQPGCGHSVYRRIHVVQVAGRLLVLGSTCFEKRRFGTALALGNATYGGGAGRALTVEERELLIQNTAELIAPGLSGNVKRLRKGAKKLISKIGTN